MWYYLEEGQQRGPVMEADLAALHKDGKITPETLVWREGMATWQALREANPALVGAPAASASPSVGAPPSILGQVTCSQCGGTFPASEVIRYGTASVCAACKPIFVQKLKEGANVTGGGSGTGWVTEAQVRERDYEHDVSGYLSSAWGLFKSDSVSLIAATVLVGLCLIVANLIPYLNIITMIVFSGPLLGGLFVFYLKKIRSQEATVGDAFSGFGPRFGQMLLVKFIPILFFILVFIPVGFVAGLVMALSAGRNHGGDPGLSGMSIIIGGVVMLLGGCVLIYLQYCWMFALWLVADKNMSFWPAMGLSRAVVRKHWWQTLWMGIVTGFLCFVGALLCVVGLLVTGPVCLAMWANAYERLFGDMEPA